MYRVERNLIVESFISECYGFQWAIDNTARVADFTSPTCSFVKYKKWDPMEHSNLEVSSSLELAQIIVSRIRSCMLLCGSAILFITIAIFLALLGYINNDKKIVLACGTFIVGGLSLGTGLVIFVTYLTETLIETSHYDKEQHFNYHYGWCFYLAGMAFLSANIAALFSLLGYIHTFPTVDEMVKQVVPGGERKLRQYIYERKSKKLECTKTQYDKLSNADYKQEPGGVTSSITPDVCTTSRCVPNFEELDGPLSKEVSVLAGQTVPIKIRNYNRKIDSPLGVYDTTQCPSVVFDPDIQVYGEDSSFYDEKNTPQKKKFVNTETMHVFESGLVNLNGKRSNKSFFGSAV